MAKGIKEPKIDDRITYVAFKLQAMRAKLEISQVEAGKRFGYTQGTICAYERGRRPPSLYYVINICKASGVKVDDLLLTDNEFMKKLTAM